MNKLKMVFCKTVEPPKINTSTPEQLEDAVIKARNESLNLLADSIEQKKKEEDAREIVEDHIKGMIKDRCFFDVSNAPCRIFAEEVYDLDDLKYYVILYSYTRSDKMFCYLFSLDNGVMRLARSKHEIRTNEAHHKNLYFDNQSIAYTELIRKFFNHYIIQLNNEAFSEFLYSNLSVSGCSVMLARLIRLDLTRRAFQHVQNVISSQCFTIDKSFTIGRSKYFNQKNEKYIYQFHNHIFINHLETFKKNECELRDYDYYLYHAVLDSIFANKGKWPEFKEYRANPLVDLEDFIIDDDNSNFLNTIDIAKRVGNSIIAVDLFIEKEHVIYYIKEEIELFKKELLKYKFLSMDIRHADNFYNMLEYKKEHDLEVTAPDFSWNNTIVQGYVREYFLDKRVEEQIYAF